MSGQNFTPNPAPALRRFRRQCERQAGRPADQIEVPLAAVLSDIARALKLSPADTARVVGRRGRRALRAWLDTEVTS